MADVYQRGVVSSATGLTNFMYQDFKISNSSDVAYALDANGAVKELQRYNLKEEIDITAIIPAESNVPTVGDSLTANGNKSSVVSADTTETNKEYKTCNIKAERFVANTIPA